MGSFPMGTRRLRLSSSLTIDDEQWDFTSYWNNAQVSAFVFRNQSFYSTVQRGQLSVSLHCSRQQYCIRDLTVTLQTGTN